MRTKTQAAILDRNDW